MKRRAMALVVGTMLLASVAWAVKPGGTLFVKVKDAKVFQKADPKSKVLGTMKPGDEVVWEGADATNKMLHKVKTPKFTGFTLQQNLSPTKPAMELASADSGKKIEKGALASSGAATKALSGAALMYANATSAEMAAKGVMSAEAVSFAIKDADAKAFGCKSVGGTCP